MKRNAMKASLKISMLVSAMAMIVVPAIGLVQLGGGMTREQFEPRVCAFYYTWYDASEFLIDTERMPDMDTGNPMPYNSSNSSVLLHHLQDASASGIDTFINTWWGPGNELDARFGEILDLTQANAIPMEHAVIFESVQDRYSSDNPNGTMNLYLDLRYVIETHGTHPNFLRINGRPVLFLFNYRARASILDWKVAIDMLHRDGLKPFLIADIGSSNGGYWRDEPGHQDIPIMELELEIFDGFHVYNPVGTYIHASSIALEKFRAVNVMARIHHELACSTVFPGYNDTTHHLHFNLDPSPAFPRNNGATYNHSWDVALASKPDWILICTYNEWREGTEIESSVELGNLYMNITREYSTTFKS